MEERKIDTESISDRSGPADATLQAWETRKEHDIPFSSACIRGDDHHVRQIKVVADVLDSGRFRIKLIAG